MPIKSWLLLPAIALAFASFVRAEGEPAVTILETPDGGIQPQAAIDGQGVIHLVYFKGEPGSGDLFYVHKAGSETSFSPPVRVNSQPASAIATGTIRGAQVALGKNGRLHVAWNGSGKARPKNPIGGSPMLYTRSNSERTSFEAQRNLMQRTKDLDGGGSLAADREGNVIVGWHGHQPGAPDGEMGRRMWVARSSDDGATFPAEEPAISEETGACGCCGTRGLADSRGNVYFLYRAALATVNRDMFLIASTDHGARFEAKDVDRWTFNACPMSSESLVEGPNGVLAAWETKGQVRFATVNPKDLRISQPVSPAGGSGDRKHPALAVNDRGETVLAWTEGTAWQRGGDLVWQIFDASGQPRGKPGRLRGGIPVWGLAAVVAEPSGRFVIIH